ncbi:MAG: hypothetical protein GF381_02610 [Candidatus Pacebacteria bacterium]|nr:hypothetical protein [Candidatus Paceibacterota bacterium]
MEINRRNFLKGVGICIGASLFWGIREELDRGLSDILTYPTPPDQEGVEDLRERISRSERDFSQYELEVENGFNGDNLGYYGYYGDELDLESYATSLETIRVELSKYPPTFCVDNGIRGVSLVGLLSYENGGSVETYGGLALPPLNKIIISAINPEEWVQRDFHHELFHLVVIDSTGDLRGLVDEKGKWGELNDSMPCSPYINGRLKIDRRPFCGNEYRARPYGMTNIQEDLATWSELMMMPELHTILWKMIYDPKESVPDDVRLILEQKYQIMMEIYAMASNNQMNGTYWENLRNGQVDQAYWFGD